MARSDQTEKVLINNESREESESIVPLKESDFEPRLQIYVCQYFGHMNGCKPNVDNHINSQHEMNIWYKCKYCQHTSADSRSMRHRIRGHHKFHIDSEEIGELGRCSRIYVKYVKTYVYMEL